MSLFLKNPKKYSYPENLYSCVFEQPPCDIELPKDWEASLVYIYSTLTERETTILISYFRDKDIMRSIAEKHGCSHQRVQQIIAKAIRKLRHPSRAKYLQHGLAAMEAKGIVPPAKLPKEDEDGITANSPSWVLFKNGWCYPLLRAGIHTVEDLTYFTETQLLGIRGIGKGKVAQIKDALASAGFSLRTEGEGEAFKLNPRALNRVPESKPVAGHRERRSNSSKVVKAPSRTYVDWHDVDPGFSVSNANASCFHRYTDDDISLLLSERILPDKNLGDPFFRKAEEAIIKACIYYLQATTASPEQNLFNVCKLLRCGALPEESGYTDTSLDQLFKTLSAKKPEHKAIHYYKIFKSAAGSTAGTVNEFCRMRLRQYLVSLRV